MNELNRRINELRQLGYGYKKIANELSITASAVRYACNKQNDDEQLIGRCKHCGLEMKSVKGKKKKVFCSDRCRWQWWNQQKAVNHHE